MTAVGGEFSGRQMDVPRLAAAAVLATLIIAALYLGREVLVPVALAVLLSFVLAPLVRLLQSISVPRAVAVVGVVLFAFTVLFGAGSLVATQLTQLAGELPRYQSTMREKIQSLRGATAGSGTLERAAEMLQDLSQELDKPQAPPPPLTNAPPTDDRPVKPIPVEVRQPDPGALESLRSLIAPLIHPLATTGIIVIFVIFILLQREDLRNRFIRLAGSHDLQRTTAALDDAARRLSRLFLTQLFINACFGIVIGVGLWLIGVPSAVLWGILAMVLRFVPYIGAFIAAAFPLALAAAVDPGWTMLALTFALFIVVEPVVGHVIEPMVYGHSTGLSPVAVVLSATFWTALWGPIGLILAVPLTICLVVLGRHVEQLAFLDVMFGDRPALSPPEIFYQRMLAGDPGEAVEIAEEVLKERQLASYYDEVALAGLRLAHADAERGALDLVRQTKIRDSVAELVDDLADQDEADVTMPTGDAEAAAAVDAVDDQGLELPTLLPAQLPPAWQGERPVLCVAGRGLIDEAAALMLGQLLGAHGLAARIEPAEALATANIFRLDGKGVAIACLSFLDAKSPALMRQAVRRLHRKLPGVSVILCCWSAGDDADTLEQLRLQTRADLVAGGLREAAKLCLAKAAGDVDVPEPAAAAA